MLKKALLLMVAAEAVSLLAYLYPVLSAPLLLAVFLGTLVLALKNPRWGIYLLFGEVFLGSKGHLLAANVGPIVFSLRLAIFAAVFLAWAAVLLGNLAQNFPRSFRGLPWLYWVLVAAVGLGAVHGSLGGNGVANVFLDANAYLYLGILPSVWLAYRERAELDNLLDILAAAVIVLGAQTAVLFVWFTYALPGVATVYHWTLDQGIGEITGNVGSASRVFLQAQFYSVMGLFVFGLHKRPYQKTIVALAVVSIILGFSRSFWLGIAGGGAFLLAVMLWRFRSYGLVILRLGVTVLLIAILEVGLLYAAVSGSRNALSAAVTSRISDPTQEAAGSARLLLLPELLAGIRQSRLAGKGFGAQITYSSYLPDKITPQNPEGKITSYAFEWGYLDIWLKLGLLGLLIYLFFIARIFRRGFDLLGGQDDRLVLGLLAGLMALLVLNLTTPYLNHPLGIGYLLLALGTFRVLSQPDKGASPA